MNPVPVQIELCTLTEEKTERALPGICGTCTKCGDSESVAIAEGRGYLRARATAPEEAKQQAVE